MSNANIKDKVYDSPLNGDVLSLIPSDAHLILDAGCGHGSLARELKAKGCAVDGVTISDAELQEARPFLRNGYLQNLEQGLPQVNSQYDVVVCSHVLEHICYPGKLLSDIYDVLKEKGQLVVALPNIMHYKQRMQLIFGNFKYQVDGHWDYTHFRWYTFQSAKELLESHGFVVEEARVTGELPFSSIFSKFLPVAIRMKCYHLLTKISKGFFGFQLLYKATKPNAREKMTEGR